VCGRTCSPRGSPAMLPPVSMMRSCSSRIPGTPGKRLRHKTTLRKAETYTSQVSLPASQGSNDPSTALLLLTKRELMDICIDCDVEYHGSKETLVQRLVKAHKDDNPSGVRQQSHAENVDCKGKLESSSLEHTIASPRKTSPQAVFPPKRRLSGGVPLPPSSWTLAQICEDAEEKRDTISPEQSSLVACPASPCQRSNPSRFSSPKNAQTSVVDSSPPKVDSPTPATTPRRSPQEPDTSESANATSTSEASSSNQWWRDVATRWPTIIAELRTGSSAPAIAATSPAYSGRKRSQSASEDFQSPKRYCLASICQSVPTPTRQTNSEFLISANANETN